MGSHVTAPGEQLGVWCLAQGHLSRGIHLSPQEKRALVIHSPTNNPCRTRDSNPQPPGYKSDSLSIRPRLPRLISNNWKYSTHSPLGNHNSFESHAITVTAPIKLQIVVIYRPPGQILATFLEELDGLLSSFMEDGTPLLVFGDFNIHLDKPYATDFHSLLASFDLKRLTTTSTHKSGNQLDLIYTRNCTTDNILVQPLHISDHFFITFTLHLPYRLLSDVTFAPFPPPFFPL